MRGKRQEISAYDYRRTAGKGKLNPVQSIQEEIQPDQAAYKQVTPKSQQLRQVIYNQNLKQTEYYK